MNDYRCPKCNEELCITVEMGATELGENPTEEYDRYNCNKCKSFWGRGDVFIDIKKNTPTVHKASEVVDGK